MAEYVPHLRTKEQRRHWYLANGEVLHEPDLLSTPAGRRIDIDDGEEDPFWASDLQGMLDQWAEKQAAEKNTHVMSATTIARGDDNKYDLDGDEWVEEKFFDRQIQRAAGDWTSPESYFHGHTARSMFSFTKKGGIVVFEVSLTSYGSRYSGSRGFEVSLYAYRSSPQYTRMVTREDSPNEFSEAPSPKRMEVEEIKDLLGEDPHITEALRYDSSSYVEAAAEYCRMSMQLADFMIIGSGEYEAYRSAWDSQYVTSLQAALGNKDRIDDLARHIEGMRDALRDMGFSVNGITESDIWNLASNGESLQLKVTDGIDTPSQVMIIDLPNGRIHTGGTKVDANSLTLYEMASARADREGVGDEFRTALALINGRKAFEKHDETAKAVRKALKILPNPSPSKH